MYYSSFEEISVTVITPNPRGADAGQHCNGLLHWFCFSLFPLETGNALKRLLCITNDVWLG